MQAFLYPSLAVLAWAAAAYRWFTLGRGRGTPAQRAATRALMLLAVTFTVSTPAVWSAADRLTGVNNIAALVAHLCVVGFSTTVQVLLLWWAHPADVARLRARRRVYVFATVTVVLLILFVAAGPTQSRPTDFVATYADRTPFAVYLLAYLTAFAAGLLDIIRICWPYAKLVGRGPLRIGLRTTSIGAAVGLVYCAVRGLDVVGSVANWEGHPLEALVPISSSIGALLVIVGVSTPAWAPRLSAAAGTVEQVRRYRELYPLWAAMSEAVPTVKLSTSGTPASWRPGERLHRRVVEIYDARLALRPYLNESVAEQARQRGHAEGLRGDDLAAVVEAATLTVALTALRAGTTPPTSPEPNRAAPSTLDEGDEVAQLARVARAFAHSAIVSGVSSTATATSPLTGGSPAPDTNPTAGAST